MMRLAAEDNFSVLVIDWLPFYFANFTDRNDRQHGKDHKSHHIIGLLHIPTGVMLRNRRKFSALKNFPFL
jgi:hypothetical protein